MKKNVAVVVPIYNEMACLPLLWQAYVSLRDRLASYQWQFVFVDDGSTDGSLAWLKARAAQDDGVLCVELSRNFGHQLAISAGLSCVSRADAVVVMDGDMQDPPELIAAMVEAFEAGADIVLARRVARAETGWRKWCMRCFHHLLIKLSDFPLVANVGIYSLLSQPVVAQLNALSEQNRYLPALRHWVGFRQVFVDYAREARAAGEPKQGFWDLFQEAKHCILSFSHMPLRLITQLGVFATCVGFGLAMVFVIKRLFFHDPAVTGFTTLLVVMVFLGGVQLLSLGLIGQYVARIHEQSMGRPLYIIRQVHRHAAKALPDG